MTHTQFFVDYGYLGIFHFSFSPLRSPFLISLLTPIYLLPPILHGIITDISDDDFIALQNDHPEEESGDTNLNTFLQLGDIIEYRDPSQKSLVKKGAIVSIGALSCSQNIIGLDNGDWLHKGVHQVRRISIKQLDHDGHVPNPYPVWKCLTKIIIFTYEDVSDGGEDDDTDEDKVYSWEEDSAAAASIPTQTDQSGQLDDDDDDDDDNEYSNSWTPKNRRKRTSCGKTKISDRVQSKRVKREDERLDRRRLTESYLCWAPPGKDYNKAKRQVNELYLKSLQLGEVDKFYEKKIHLQRSKTTFMKVEKEFRRFLANRQKSDSIMLKIANSVDIQFMDNPGHGVVGRSKETYRSRRTKEEIIKFEFKMRTLQVTTCRVCRENKLAFPKGVIPKDKPKTRRNSLGNHVCDRCKRNKSEESNKYLKENLHPIWYERDDSGNFKYDSNGEKIVRYDIPEELKSLTMAEKLLIRRCSPLIPSHHIRNGIYGISGHCVTFAQDISSMCTELPQKESNMVIFVRNLSNRISGAMHTQHFKVNKQKVLRALEWLKMHHVGYKDIIINKSNLDWIKKGTIYDVAKKYTLQAKTSKRDTVREASETVSSNQCDGDENDLSFSTVHPNARSNVPTKEQGDIIRSLEESAKTSNQKYDTLDFPPVDPTKPLW